MSQTQSKTLVHDGKVEFEMTLGYSYSRSGRCWFRRYIVKVWVKDGERYIGASPSTVVETLNKDWHVSRTKRYSRTTMVAPEGTVIKVFDTKHVVYYLVTSQAEGGLVELKHDSVGVDVISTPKVRVRYFKNVVYLPDGRTIEDVDDDPKLYIYGRRVEGEWRLSQLEELKKRMGVS